MHETQLLEGVRLLDELAQGDYHESLAEVLDTAPETAGAERLGRLIGVTLKQPFAEVHDFPAPSPYSHAYRGWDLSEKAFAEPGIADTWQYRTLEALLSDPAADRQFSSVVELAQEAHYERGFFGFLARSVQKYICNDPKLRKEIDKNVRAGKAAGFNVKVLTPEQLVQGGGVALASFLIVHVPVLGMVGAPVIAGFVLLFYRIGADAYCDWVKTLNPDRERH